jgi:hypothetical protein
VGENGKLFEHLEWRCVRLDAHGLAAGEPRFYRGDVVLQFEIELID